MRYFNQPLYGGGCPQLKPSLSTASVASPSVRAQTQAHRSVERKHEVYRHENKTSETPWFQVSRRQSAHRSERPSVRLFCFSYAGGSASVFKDWHRYLGAHVELQLCQMPGRGVRFKEAPLSCMSDLLDALEVAIRPIISDGIPFAFFGHSMGAQVAFELTRRLERKGLASPSHLFCSGRKAPQLPLAHQTIHNLPEVAFREAIRSLNGTPKEALEHEELMELVSPMLRADFKMIETWQHLDGSAVKAAMIVMGGLQDDRVSEADLDAWKVHAGNGFKRLMFEGDHFYLNSVPDSLLSVVDKALKSAKRPVSTYRSAVGC